LVWLARDRLVCGRLVGGVRFVRSARADDDPSNRRPARAQKPELCPGRGDDLAARFSALRDDCNPAALHANLLGYTAVDAGIAMSPRGIGAFLATIIVGRLVGRISNRILIGAGFVLLSYSCLLLGHINLQIGMSSIVVPLLLAEWRSA
jgi:hypothetical protein